MALGTLVTRLKFDGDYTDTQGNNNFASAGSGNSFSTTDKKEGTGSLTFTSSGWTDKGSAPTGLSTGNADFTYMGWFKTSTFGNNDANSPTFFFTGTFTTSQQRCLKAKNATAFNCQFYANDVEVALGQTLSTGVWYHIAWVYTASSRVSQVYINGTLAGSGTQPSNGNHQLTNMSIARDGGGYNPLVGSVDDARFYEGAGTAAEILNIYKLYQNKSFQVDTGNTLRDGLVSYYKLGDTTDFYGSKHGTASNVTFVAGKYNNAASFNGSTSYISLGATNGFGISGNVFSFSGWGYMTSTSTPLVLLSNYNGGSFENGDISLVYYTADQKLRLQAGTGSGVGAGYISSSALGLSANTWYHFVFTYDGSQSNPNKWKAYINGSSSAVQVEGSNNGDTGNIFQNASTMYIGGGAIWGTTTGYQDEHALFSKVLSTTEISDLYNGGNGQTMNPPIEFDAFTANAQEPGTSATFSHTCGTGNNRLLLVGVWINEASASIMSSVTYGGVTMTSLKRSVITSTWSQYFYYLLAPATGANNVVVTWNGSSKYVYTRVCSYVGVAQTGFPDVDATASGTGTSIVATGTTTKDNVWIAGMWGNASYTNGTPTAPIVARSAAEFQYFDSNSPITPAGSKSVTYTVTGSQNSDLYWVAFAPYEATTTNTSNFFLFFD